MANEPVTTIETTNKPSTLYDEAFKKALEEVIDSVSTPSTGDSELHQVEVEGLAKYVQDCFDKSCAARQEIENKWVQDLRQYKGIYAPEVLAKMNKYRAKAFIRLTRAKVKTVDSRLADLLFPANGDKNWSIEPTPIPEFSDKKMAAILQLWKEESGEDATRESLEMLMNEEAKKQARKMSKVIEDQLVELKYREIMRNVIHSGNVYGTGVLKGPLVTITENRQYYKQVTKNGKETWLLQEHDAITPFVEYVRVWDMYPDMGADNLDDCRYIVQRRKMDKHDLVGLSKRSDFDADIILKYLDSCPDGDYERLPFEQELSSLGDIIQAQDAGSSSSKKYEVLEFWGYVDAVDLERYGVEIPTEKKSQVELIANIWTLGDYVIKATLSPLEGVKWPYFFYYYDKDETSLFGEGIPSIMKDIQDLINSSFRAMLDNAAISAGPQVEVNLDLLSEDEDPRDFYPFKVWLRTGEGADASNPAIRQLQIQTNSAEYLNMIELFRTYGDEITSIPRTLWGEPTGTNTRTSGGLSMLMGNANITIKDQVKNFDDGITKPFITALYYWNMQFNSDEDVKGDYAVVARGSSSLIAKEVRSQTLIQFAQMTANQMDVGTVKRPALIRAIAESLDLDNDNLVYTDKEIEVQQQQQQQAAQEERQWMSEMVEVAREYGISPSSMLDSLRMMRRELNENPRAPEGFVGNSELMGVPGPVEQEMANAKGNQ